MSRTVRVKSSLSWGHGLMLNDGQILTAAHVVDKLDKQSELEILDLHGRHVGKATILKVADRETTDLALLALKPVDPSMPQKFAILPVCKKNIVGGDPIFVAYENTGVITHASMDDVFIQLRGSGDFSIATQAFFSNGVSGSGVYSMKDGCLAGVISRRSSTGLGNNSCLKTIAKGLTEDKACGAYFGTEFVPAESIASFLRSES